MGKVDLGINLAKDVAAFLKAGRGHSLLRRQPSIFHGINPTLTYPPTGKTFALPRFCTVEMKQARQMNRIASSQIKAPINSTFSKASAEDLRRLTSQTIEDSYSRVLWTNPKDGKVYNLLKQGETEDGKVLVRILDQDGAFIKEAEIMPKKIAIIDEFVGKRGEYVQATHGDMVVIFAKRNNPFAKYDIIERKNIADENEIQKILKQNSYDYINCSFGTTIFPKDIWVELTGYNSKELAKIGLDRDLLFNFEYSNEALFNAFIKARKEFPNKFTEDHLFDFLNKLSKKGTRVLKASGNDGRKTVEAELLFNNRIEGVGSLSSSGKISNFSSSGNSRYTQHYEKGEFEVSKTEYGLNITGIPGTDIDIGSIKLGDMNGTSFSTPIRVAKLALNDMMEGIL